MAHFIFYSLVILLLVRCVGCLFVWQRIAQSDWTYKLHIDSDEDFDFAGSLCIHWKDLTVCSIEMFLITTGLFLSFVMIDGYDAYEYVSFALMCATTIHVMLSMFGAMLFVPMVVRPVLAAVKREKMFKLEWALLRGIENNIQESSVSS